MPSKLLHKNVWKNAVGAFKKPRRLHLVADADGYFYCPVHNCDTDGFRSQRGCRKHVFMKHGWYYYFHEKPTVDDVLPAPHLRTNSRLPRTKRSTTSKMPMFQKMVEKCRRRREKRYPSRTNSVQNIEIYKVLLL